MHRLKLVLLFSALFFDLKNGAFGQLNDFPYELDIRKEIIISGIGLGLQGSGYFLNEARDDRSFSFAGANRKNIPAIDRWSVEYHSENAAQLSDATELLGISLPLTISLFQGIKSRKKGLVLLTMYAETIVLSTGLTNTTKGAVCRYRPYVYSSHFPSGKDQAYAAKSFFSGHTSTTAASSFFAAKVFCDLYPSSKLKPYAWALAATLPATTGALRIKAGRHFLTDVFAGYVTGAAWGMLVPHLHRKKKTDKIRGILD